MPKKEYPYQNLSMKDIKGERWEDIPGLDGYFCVSNYGRVKRMEFEMQYKDGRICIRPEKIIKPMIVKQQNKFIGDYSYFLTVRLVLSGKKYSFTVARLVYHCFADASFNMDDHKSVILAKNYDNFNVKPSNLLKATLHQKQKRIFQRTRSRSPLLDLSKEFLDSVRQKIIKTQSKQVTQYTRAGKKIKTFSSMAAAQRATGVHAVAIREVAIGENITAGGFLWRWGNEKKINVNAKNLKEARRKEHRKNYNIISVTQYDMEGNRIAYYPSLTDAEEATGVNGGQISLAAKGIYKSARGYFWIKGYGKEKIDLSGHQWGVGSRMRKITQYSLKGKKLNVFSSIKTAAEATNSRTSSINQALNGSQLKAGKYIWRYGNGAAEIDLTDYWEKGRREAALKRRKPVTQYSLQGDRIAIYSGIVEAGRKTNILYTLISRCMNGEIRSAKGFIWRKGEGSKKISVRNIMYREKFFANNRKQVAQYTLNGKHLTTYESVKKAAEITGIQPANISGAARGKYSHSQGYIWKYI